MRGYTNGRNEIETGADSECRDESAQNNTGSLPEFDQLLKFCAAENKKGGHSRGGDARQVVKTEIRLWYFCGQMRNRRSFHCGDFQFWWT